MTTQVVTRPTVEKIRETLNRIFGPVETTCRKNGERSEIFVPRNVVEALKQAKMDRSLGLVDEDVKLSNPAIKAFWI